MRLGGWVRLGIVASVIWAIGAYLYQMNVVTDRAARFANTDQAVCYIEQKTQPDLDCSKAWRDGFDKSMGYSWGVPTVAALVPIPFGWLFVWLTVVVVRWVRAGFR
jgi:hypothetical protein